MTALELPCSWFLLPRMLLLLPYSKLELPLIWLLFPLVISFMLPKIVLDAPKALLRSPTTVVLIPMRELLEPLIRLLTPCIWLLEPCRILLPTPVPLVLTDPKMFSVEKRLPSCCFCMEPAFHVDWRLLNRSFLPPMSKGDNLMISQSEEVTRSRQRRPAARPLLCLLGMVYIFLQIEYIDNFFHRPNLERYCSKGHHWKRGMEKIIKNLADFWLVIEEQLSQMVGVERKEFRGGW